MIAPPLSLYVHLPWCVQKCPYCDFNSHTAGDAAPRERYLDALLGDLDCEADRGASREPATDPLLGRQSTFEREQEGDACDAGEERDGHRRSDQEGSEESDA